MLDLSLSACSTIKGLYSVDSNGNNPNYNCGKLVENAINISAKQYPNVPIIIINRTSQNLHGFNEHEDSLSALPTNFVNKVFVERNDEYRINLTEHMVNTICEFSENNPVYLMRPTPELITDVPLTMFRTSMFNGVPKKVKIPLTSYQERQRTAYRMQDEAVTRCGAKILDPIPYLCNSDSCYGDKNGIPLYFDDDHLSSYGSKLISPIYDEVFK
ncbi:O-antigen acetylase [Psychrobacter aquaticus CMS 56]|uniref:O-antigen acetylase n=1 Tax=Psychrobacter aquaticus CMS 56 TaxID=1354303 RepID=U4T4C4_9GAMM|nr:O-antigen acetylase [Psychrobacter aquaticus CMS 56]